MCVGGPVGLGCVGRMAGNAVHAFVCTRAHLLVLHLCTGMGRRHAACVQAGRGCFTTATARRSSTSEMIINGDPQMSINGDPSLLPFSLLAVGHILMTLGQSETFYGQNRPCTDLLSCQKRHSNGIRSLARLPCGSRRRRKAARYVTAERSDPHPFTVVPNAFSSHTLHPRITVPTPPSTRPTVVRGCSLRCERG